MDINQCIFTLDPMVGTIHMFFHVRLIRYAYLLKRVGLHCKQVCHKGNVMIKPIRQSPQHSNYFKSPSLINFCKSCQPPLKMHSIKDRGGHIESNHSIKDHIGPLSIPMHIGDSRDIKPKSALNFRSLRNKKIGHCIIGSS